MGAGQLLLAFLQHDLEEGLGEVAMAGANSDEGGGEGTKADHLQGGTDVPKDRSQDIEDILTR